MTNNEHPSSPPTLTLVEKLYAVHNINSLIPEKLDLAESNYSTWIYFFKGHCSNFGVLRHIEESVTEALTSTPPTDEWITADSIIKSWIFLTLSSTLRKRLIKANPKMAKAAWDAIETIFQDNKRTRTISLKGELRVIQMGDQTDDEYFSKIEAILALLTDLGTPRNSNNSTTHGITQGTLPMHAGSQSSSAIAEATRTEINRTNNRIVTTVPQHVICRNLWTVAFIVGAMLVVSHDILSFHAIDETFGHTTSHVVGSALEDTYRHDSLERTHTLGDSLRYINNGSSIVSILFSQLQGLITPRPKFHDLVSQAESHEMFLQSINDSTVASVTLNTTFSHADTNSSSSRGRGRSYSRGSSNRDVHTFACHPSTIDANLIEAFQAQCNTSAPYWFVDTWASTHMTLDYAHLDVASSYSRNESVIFGNGDGAFISHIGRSYISLNISLLDAFSQKMRHSKETLAQGRRRKAPTVASYCASTSLRVRSPDRHSLQGWYFHVSALVIHQALFAIKEPKGFKSVATDPKWFAVMCDEMKALKHNATWDLVPCPTKSKIFGSNWVFLTKFLANGTIDKFKARLAADVEVVKTSQEALQSPRQSI
ncbi:hybrid signal transduction histidine kinase M [Tanacetum coccineum]